MNGPDFIKQLTGTPRSTGWIGSTVKGRSDKVLPRVSSVRWSTGRTSPSRGQKRPCTQLFRTPWHHAL